jgi:hypothetical protein
MKRWIALLLALSLVPCGFCGCGDTTKVTKEKKVETPGGSTTVKTETEVKKTGEDPPPP